MRNKLIANLSFNPSLVEQLGFYSRRLKQEESIRRLGLVMIVLSMLVQVFAASFPAEKSLAYSDNHIINGVKTRQDILRSWDSPGSDIPQIYGKFGVTRKDIVNLPNRPNATIHSNGNNFWSIGRNSLSGYSNIKDNFKDEEIALKASDKTIYLRPLRAWDAPGTNSSYRAFKGRNSTTGEVFWILVDCGNYTQIGKGRPPRPSLQVRKTIVGNPSNLRPGQTIKFRVEYRNQREDSLAENVVLTDNLDRKKYDPISKEELLTDRGNMLRKDLRNVQFTDNSRVFDFAVKLKNNLKNGTRVCNHVRLTSSNANTVSDEVCTTVAAGGNDTGASASSNQPVKPPDLSSPLAPQIAYSPGFSKSVKNLSNNLSDIKATEFPVRAGDIIEYALTTTNSSPVDIENYVIKDYAGDLLDYADIDEEFLASQGGSYVEKSKEIIWHKTKLPASSETIKKFRIQIKSPIPSTNSPSKLTTNFDCKISNEYGDEITMDVECPFVKSVETLPNTGPGTTISFAFTVTVVSSYFLIRSRLLAKEFSVAKRIFPSSGGAR